MRARPEPTQLEWLSDASFLGKLLVLPANVRLDWKVIARYNHSSLLGLVISNEEKSFIILTPGGSVVLRYFWNFYLVKNHKIAKNSTTTVAGEKISTYFGILKIL